jgi:hypothetical protein
MNSDEILGIPAGLASGTDGSAYAKHTFFSLDSYGIPVYSSYPSFAGLAVTRMDPSVAINARTYNVLNQPDLATDGTTETVSLGVAYHAPTDWSWNAVLSYTPIDIRRPPTGASENQEFWSLRLGLQWHVVKNAD